MKTSKLILACCLTVGIICIGLGEVSHATVAASDGQEELPLFTMGSFTLPRTQYPLSTHHSVEMMRAELEKNFNVTYVDLDSLLDPRFCEIDLFFVNAWEVEPLSGEVAAASQYVQSGGTLLVNAAGASGLLNVNAWIEPFLLESEPFHLGGDSRTYTVADSSDPIIEGPFGIVELFHNRYESIVHGLAGVSFDDAGVVLLAVTAVPENAVLALVPWSDNRAGQALIVTNFHVFHDTGAGAGGFMHTADSQKLLLNLAASSRLSSACVLEVDIDIKPGSDPNTINLGSKGVIPVAILSSMAFDAGDVDPITVELGGAGVAVRGKGKSLAHMEDVNGDGLPDLVVQVETESLGLDTEAGDVILTGTTYDGQDIQGSDTIVIVPNQ